MEVVKAANELSTATLRCDLRGILQARLGVHNLAASFDGLLQDCHPPSDVDLRVNTRGAKVCLRNRASSSRNH